MSVSKPHRPFPIKLINIPGKLGFKIPGLKLDKMIKAAKRSTGLNDFGNEDFMERLAVLINSLNNEGRLTTIGRISAKETISRYLRNRLLIENHLKNHPEIEQQEIRKPLIIAGLPRTGTTILFNLLAEDPANRVPMSWEATLPFPPPKTATYDSDPRIQEMQKMFDQLSMLAPGLMAIHEFGALLPQECIPLISYEFVGVEFHSTYYVPGFLKFVDKQSWLPGYQYHKRMLQYLQSEHKKERWVLKTPGHLPVMDQLLEVYPDACIIHTHRDPMKVLTSVSSLNYTLRGIGMDELDPKEVGPDQLDMWESYLNRAIDVREKLGKNNPHFFDVQFEEVLEDPIALIERIYKHFDIPFSDEAKTNMQNHIKNKPRGQFGKHTYHLEDFGLDEKRDRPRLQRYCDYFNIPINTGL